MQALQDKQDGLDTIDIDDAHSRLVSFRLVLLELMGRTQGNPRTSHSLCGAANGEGPQDDSA
jgi:hypothetical protein